MRAEKLNIAVQSVACIREVTVITLVMTAVSTYETFVNFYETTRRNIPEGCLSSSYLPT
jgi:hypothetical protein